MPRVAKLAIVEEREGNPGKRPISPGVRLEPQAPPEPAWSEIFPGSKPGVARCRQVAGRVWSLVVGQMDAQGLVSTLDEFALTKLCVYEAIFDQATRDIARNGHIVKGRQQSTIRNPALMTLSQAGSMLPALYREFGMTPLARDRLNPRGGDDQGAELFDG